MKRDLSTVRLLVKAEIIHLSHQIEALQTLSPEGNFTFKNVADSITLQSPAVYGRKLNHTYGFGAFGPVTMGDLRLVEQAYDDSGLQPELDMCDFADASALDLLSTRYSVTGTICQYISGISYQPTGFGDVKVSPSLNHEAFVHASVEGFRSTGRSLDLLTSLAKSSATRSDTTLFFATLEGDLVGTAAMAIFEVDGYKVAVLYIDSSLPAARGKGVHRALLLARLKAAKEHGCDFATVGAREGSGSARNIQNVGFDKAYTCKTYTKN